MGQPFDPQYAPQAHAQQPKKGMGCGTIALIVAAVAIPVIVIFAAIAMNGFRRYMNAAKASEAKATTQAIYMAAASAYERDGKLCGSATRAPATVPSGNKVSPGSDFGTGDAGTGWRCLAFTLEHPVYFAYTYELVGPDRFKVTATGDLDGDGEQSSYVLEGQVSGDRVGPAPPLEITNEGE